MEKFNLCPLCKEEYGPKVHIPKLLKCGHTFCLPCLENLTRFIRICPECKRAFTKKTYKLPTNIALIRTHESDFDGYNKTLSNVKASFLEKKEQVSKISKIIDKLNLSIDYNLKRIDQMTSETKGETERDLTEALKHIETYEMDLQRIDIYLYRYFKPKIKPTLSLNQFTSKKKFLHEIVLRLYKKEMIYALKAQTYDSEIYLGKLSLRNGRLCADALSSTESFEGTFALVELSDLMDCSNFQTFIDVDEEEIVCSLVSRSEEALRFVMLCSGIEGTSFRGNRVDIKTIPHLGEDLLYIDYEAGAEMKKEVIDNGFAKILPVFLPSSEDIRSSNKIRVKMFPGRCEIERYNAFRDEHHSGITSPSSDCTTISPNTSSKSNIARNFSGQKMSFRRFVNCDKVVALASLSKNTKLFSKSTVANVANCGISIMLSDTPNGKQKRIKNISKKKKEIFSYNSEIC